MLKIKKAQLKVSILHTLLFHKIHFFMKLKYIMVLKVPLTK